MEEISNNMGKSLSTIPYILYPISYIYPPVILSYVLRLGVLVLELSRIFSHVGFMLFITSWKCLKRACPVLKS